MDEKLKKAATAVLDEIEYMFENSVYNKDRVNAIKKSAKAIKNISKALGNVKKNKTKGFYPGVKGGPQTISKKTRF